VLQPLIDGPRSALATADVTEALSMGRGASVRHGVDVLTAVGAETGRALPFEAKGSSVTWAYRAPDAVAGQSDDAAAARRQATLIVPASTTENLNAIRARVWTEWLLTTGAWARFYLGVFLVVNPGAIVDDGLVLRRTLQLADKTYLWANTFLTGPWRVPSGTVVTTYVQGDLGSRFGETQFAIAASASTLAQAVVFETGTSWLSVYSKLLQAIGYSQLTTDEIGRPASRPLSDQAAQGIEYVYGAAKGKVLTAGQVEPLLPTLPNVVRFSARQGPSLGNVEGNGQKTVTNQSTGPASVDSRGGVHVELRVDVDADSQTALDAIAAAEAQRYFAGGGLRWSGSVGLNPRHSDRDVVAFDLPRLGLAATDAWVVTSWTYPLGDLTSEQDVLMPITAERRVA
jgi:hypothetical protein